MSSEISVWQGQQFWQSKISTESLLNAVCELDQTAQFAIYLRFWESFSIAEISKLLSLSWDAVDRILENTFRKLRAKVGRDAMDLNRAVNAAS